MAYSSSIPKGSVWDRETLVRSSKRTTTVMVRATLSLPAQRARDDAGVHLQRLFDLGEPTSERAKV